MISLRASSKTMMMGVAMLAVGTRAPEFRVKDHRSRDVSLADFTGRTVVLWFYPKADTPG